MAVVIASDLGKDVAGEPLLRGIATSELGGVGRPLTLDAIFNSFFSFKSSDLYPPESQSRKADDRR